MRKILITSVLSLLVCLVWGQSYSYRYWTDNDVGNAVTGSGSGETQFILNTASLSSGLHALHVQARDAAGLWSSVRTRYFYVARDANQVSSARYWIDKNMSTMHNDVAAIGEIEIDISKVGVGLHAIHYQKIASDGTPSSTFTRYFYVARDANQITSARYWLDSDMSTMHNNVATSGIIDIDISKLSAGLHAIHYQKIAADGTPSSVRTRYFVLAPKQTDNLTAAIGIDDGEKTVYPLTGEDIVIDLGELKGEHVLHVALYDNLNRLIGEQTQTFMAAPVEVLTVETTEAGTLANYIANADRYTLKELTITGPLNSTDFKLLRDMAGNNYLGEETAGKLQILDLSGATIVTGGEYYYETGQLAIAQNDELGEGVFKDCKLTKIVLPRSLTAIGPYAFEGCTALTDVISYIKKPFDIARNNFCLTRDGDFTTATLTVPYNTKAAYQQADGWKYFTTIVEMSAADTNIDFADDKVKTVCVGHWDTNDDGELSYAEAAAVTTLGTAFKGTGIETFDELIYFTGLTSISDYAFQGCSGLTAILIPEGVTSIGQLAFDCSNLTTVTALRSNPPTITGNTFTNSANTTLYVLSAESKELYKVADYWKDFGRITYDGEPEPPQVIAFADATAKAICVYYWDANGDGELDVEEAAAVTTIGDVFQGSDITSFDELRYFTGVTTIGYMAFAECKKLTSIIIPSGVTTVEGATFYYCDALTSVKVDEENLVFDSHDNCNAIIEKSTATLWAGCKTTIIPNDVKAIADVAFYRITGLTELTLPQGLQSIGYGALYGTGLTSVVIPKSVTSIDFEVFGNINSLERIVVEQGNTVFDSRGGCNAVIETATNNLIAGCKTTVIPGTVSSIDYCAFDVIPLTALHIPASVTAINDLAVRVCNCLSSITVDAGNKVYDSRVGCNAIMETATGQLLLGCANTVIPETALSIGKYAFQGCDAMVEVVLPKSITAIGTNSFDECDNLTTVVAYMQQPPVITENTFTNRANATLYVPNGCKALYEAADYWKEFKTITEMEPVVSPIIEFADATTKAYCVYYWDTDGDGELSEDEAAAVTAIGSEFQKSNITSFDELRYFTGLTTIKKMAFTFCQQLQSIVIPRCVTTVGGGLFHYCDALTSVKVVDENPVLISPEGCNAIINRVTGTLLAGCTTTVIPDGVTAIGDMAFYHVHKLSELTLPQGLKSIGMGGLFGLLDIETLVIPKSVTSIGNEAFGNMNSLVSLTVEDGNTVFDSRDGCNAVIETATNTLVAGCATTVIPNTVTAISKYAFDVCPITKLNIPASVTAIDELAVRICHNISTITVAAGNRVYDSRRGCNAIIETATRRLLLGCMTTVIPVGTKSIANYAFYGCDYLESISIPSSVTAIGENAFSDCERLKSVTAGMQQPPAISESTFTSRTDATLYVPIGCRSLYMAADYWKDFKSIVEIEIVEDILLGDVNDDGEITAQDASLVLQAVAGKIVLSDAQTANADVNNDGSITAQDASLILQYVAGKTSW